MPERPDQADSQPLQKQARDLLRAIRTAKFAIRPRWHMLCPENVSIYVTEWQMAEALKAPIQNEPLVLSYMDRTGRIAINRLADGFGMSKSQLAETAGLARETLYRAERSRAPRTQGRLREMLEIISRVTEWAGGKEQAMAWYRAHPLPAFGGRTAEALVKEGKAAAVRDYLDHMALGGFA